MIEVINGDCLHVLDEFDDDYFDVAVFSPPYGVSNGEFDIRYDFAIGGKFIPYMEQIARVSRLVAINVTQKVYNTVLFPFIEQMTMALAEQNVTLFDRWVVIKPAHMPRRGNRALTRYEFVLLYTRHGHSSIVKLQEGSTVIPVKSHGMSTVTGLGMRPYFPEIPRQVISMYCSDWVLDPFCGTGTTLREARALGKNGVGIELNAETYQATKDYHERQI